jgi:uncharacterized Zn-finger protein
LNLTIGVATSPCMEAIPPPEVIKVTSSAVACDGAGEIAASLGHPRVYLRLDPATGMVECGYCDRRFILEGGPADTGA